MRVNVFLVHMGTDDKSVFPLRQRHCQFIADFVRQLRRDFSRLKRLPQMVGNHIMFLLTVPGDGSILPLGKKKLLVCDSWIALVSCHQFAAIGFLWLFYINFVFWEENFIVGKEKQKGIYFKVSERERNLIEQKMTLAGVHNMSAFIRKMSIDGWLPAIIQQ